MLASLVYLLTIIKLMFKFYKFLNQRYNDERKADKLIDLVLQQTDSINQKKLREEKYNLVKEDSKYLLKADIPGKIVENAGHISGSMREKPWKQNC